MTGPQRMTLAAGAELAEDPDRLLIYGQPGVGKSTLAAAAPAPVLLPVEKVGRHITGALRGRGAVLPHPESWADVLAGVRTVQEERHDYQSLIVDTLDAAEALCWAEVCRRAKKDSIEDFGYGKGYVAAVDEWRVLLAALEQLQRRRAMRVILIAHGARKVIRNPEGKDYDAWALNIHEKASGLIRGWCDAVLFAQWESFTDGEGDKGKLVSTGRRILRTQESGPWQAKNRHNLPAQVPLSWPDLAAAMEAGTQTPDQVRARIRCAAQGTAFEEQADEQIKKVGEDVIKLLAVEKWLAGRLAGKDK